MIVYVVVRYTGPDGREYVDSVSGVFSSMEIAQAWIKRQDGTDECDAYSYDIERHTFNEPSKG